MKMTQRKRTVIYHIINVLIPFIFFVCATIILKRALELELPKRTKYETLTEHYILNYQYIRVIKEYAEIFFINYVFPAFCIVFSVRLSRSKIGLPVYSVWNAVCAYVAIPKMKIKPFVIYYYGQFFEGGGVAETLFDYKKGTLACLLLTLIPGAVIIISRMLIRLYVKKRSIAIPPLHGFHKTIIFSLAPFFAPYIQTIISTLSFLPFAKFCKQIIPDNYYFMIYSYYDSMITLVNILIAAFLILPLWCAFYSIALADTNIRNGFKYPLLVISPLILSLNSAYFVDLNFASASAKPHPNLLKYFFLLFTASLIISISAFLIRSAIRKKYCTEQVLTNANTEKRIEDDPELKDLSVNIAESKSNKPEKHEKVKENNQKMAPVKPGLYVIKPPAVGSLVSIELQNGDLAFLTVRSGKDEEWLSGIVTQDKGILTVQTNTETEFVFSVKEDSLVLQAFSPESDAFYYGAVFELKN